MGQHGPTRTEPASAPPLTRRLFGLDLARAVAFAGMVLAHYVSPFGPGEPGWLLAADAAADGRAAPLFCVLLGVGAGLLIARGTPDRVLVRRGIALFVLGLAVWPLFSHVYLILPQYGVLLVVVPLLRRLPTVALLPVAAVAFVVPSVVASGLDGHALRAGAQPTTYGDLLDVPELVRVLLWTGGYPVVGWVGFVLVGLWLARQRLGDAAVQWRLLVAGAAVAALQPLATWGYEALGGDGVRTDAGGLATFLDGHAHTNRTAWYVLATASAVAVIGAALLLTAGPRPGWRWPIICLGQLALTAYLAHLLLGREVIWPWLADESPALVTQLVVAGVVLVAFAAAATLWRTRFRRGPLEAAVRAVAG